MWTQQQFTLGTDHDFHHRLIRSIHLITVWENREKCRTEEPKMKSSNILFCLVRSGKPKDPHIRGAGDGKRVTAEADTVQMNHKNQLQLSRWIYLLIVLIMNCRILTRSGASTINQLITFGLFSGILQTTWFIKKTISRLINNGNNR